MTRAIHLDTADVPPVLRNVFPGYRGGQWVVEITDTVRLSDTQWSGGSRSEYRGVDLETGQSTQQDPRSKGAWFNPVEPIVELSTGRAIVEHHYYRGKDMGCRVYIHPDNAAKLVKGPSEVGEVEGRALSLICSTKGGEYRRDEWNRANLPGGYNADNPLIQTLASRGFLKINKRGGIMVTTAGRNARPS